MAAIMAPCSRSLRADANEAVSHTQRRVELFGQLVLPRLLRSCRPAGRDRRTSLLDGSDDVTVEFAAPRAL
jgi:hypothetical protein